MSNARAVDHSEIGRYWGGALCPTQSVGTHHWTRLTRVVCGCATSKGPSKLWRKNRLEESKWIPGWEVVQRFIDKGISGSKGRDGRPAFDALCKGIVRREFDVVAAWSVDRLGRSLQDLVAFLNVVTMQKRIRKSSITSHSETRNYVSFYGTILCARMRDYMGTPWTPWDLGTCLE